MKRLIFTILYEDGKFILSRNFRKQKIGSIDWLYENYNLLDVSFGIDEIIVIDTSENKNKIEFCKIIEKISEKLFIPVTAGGGINNVLDAKVFQEYGADKILLNKLLYKDPKAWEKIAEKYGKQFIVSCIDYKNNNNNIEVYFDGAKKLSNLNMHDTILSLLKVGTGEIILQSVDKDGSGTGLDLDIITHINNLNIPCPLILLGGVGKPEHILNGLINKRVDAVSTANLFNFVGKSFLQTREYLINRKLDLNKWDNENFLNYKDKFL